MDVLSQVHFIRAAFNVERGRPRGPDLSRAEEEIRQVVAQEPRNSDAWLQLGEVQLASARGRHREEMDTADTQTGALG